MDDLDNNSVQASGRRLVATYSLSNTVKQMMYKGNLHNVFKTKIITKWGT